MTKLLLPLALVACSPPPKPAPPPPRSADLYRLDFVIASTDAGGAPARSTYTLNVEDHSSGEVHVGANVALSDHQRMDVGVKIRCHVESAGDRVLLTGNTEVSTTAQPASIQKMVVRGDALAGDGKPALLASLDEPSTHTHYEVTVLATKL